MLYLLLVPIMLLCKVKQFLKNWLCTYVTIMYQYVTIGIVVLKLYFVLYWKLHCIGNCIVYVRVINRSLNLSRFPINSPIL